MGVSNTIQQLSVFLENREGRLDDVLKVLSQNDVNIVALSLADTSDYGMLRMVVSDPNKGRTALKEAAVLKSDDPARVIDILKASGFDVYSADEAYRANQ